MAIATALSSSPVVTLGLVPRVQGDGFVTCPGIPARAFCRSLGRDDGLSTHAGFWLRMNQCCARPK